MNKYGYFKVAAAVPSVRVADCQYNAEHIVAMMRRAADRGVRVVVFPELSITGASCGDLLRQPMLLSAAELHEQLRRHNPYLMRGVNAQNFGALLREWGFKRVEHHHRRVYQVVMNCEL